MCTIPQRYQRINHINMICSLWRHHMIDPLVSPMIEETTIILWQTDSLRCQYDIKWVPRWYPMGTALVPRWYSNDIAVRNTSYLVKSLRSITTETTLLCHNDITAVLIRYRTDIALSTTTRHHEMRCDSAICIIRISMRYHSSIVLISF